MAISNGLYFSVIEVPPLQGVGWEIRVLDYKDFDTRASTDDDGPPLCILSTFTTCTISPEISALGAGSVTLDLDSPFWFQTLANGAPATYLLEHEHVWQVFDNGVLRFEFLGQTRSIPDQADSGNREVVISGPGGGDVLRRSKIFTVQYPYPAKADSFEVGQYQFTRTPLMAAWLILLGKSKDRGTNTFVRPTFNETVDSAGEPWEDTPAPRTTTTNTNTTTTVLAGDVLFDSDSYTLKSSATAVIATMVAPMAADARVALVGHTDSTNTVAYNQTLSVNRANAVAARIQQLRPQATITKSGRGELAPIATNSTSAGRAKNRRVTVTYTNTVTSTTDTSGSDIVYMPPLGQDMLALLKEMAGEDPEQPAVIRVEWLMRPGFKLDVRRRFGRRREADVVFYEGSRSLKSKSRDRSSEQVANLIAVQDDFGNYAIGTSQESIDTWGQREEYSRRNSAYNENARTQLAQKMLEQRKDEISTWTIAVPPYAEGRVVFQDYDLGDWVGVSRWRIGGVSAVDAFRVIAISLKCDANGMVEAELTLQSSQEVRLRRLQEQITSIVDHTDKGTYTYITDDEPAGANIGDIWIPKTPGVY